MAGWPVFAVFVIYDILERMKNFFHNIQSSIYNPQFYAGLKGKPFSFSLKYFLSLMFFLSLIFGLFFSLFVLPEMKKNVTEFFAVVQTQFPQELTITLKDGAISTNAEVPYLFPITEDLRSLNQNKDLKNFLVIDTKNEFSLEKFESYQTTFLVTKNHLVAKSENGEVRITPLKGFPDYEITKASISSLSSRLLPFVRYMTPIFILMVVTGIFVGTSLGYLAYLLIASILIFIVAKIMKLDFSYGTSYQVGLHAITASLILDLLSYALGFSPPFFSFTLLMLIAIIFNFKTQRA